jgi:hypothetical protein
MKHCSWSSLKDEDTIISVMSLEQQSPMDASALPEEIKNPALPKEFNEFSDIFSKWLADTLPPLTKYNHTIPLEEGTKPPFGPIYALSETELKALDIYLKENLAKQFILQHLQLAHRFCFSRSQMDHFGCVSIIVDLTG